MFARTQARWQGLARDSLAVLPSLEARTRSMFLTHVLAQQLLLGNASLALAHLANAILGARAGVASAIDNSIAALEDCLGKVPSAACVLFLGVSLL